MKYTKTAMSDSSAFTDAMSSVSVSSARLMLSKEFEHFINKLPPNWSDKFEKPTSVEQAYGFIAERAVSYRHMVDGDLASAYTEDFGDWEIADWNLVNKDILRSFSIFLRKRGLFVKTSNLPTWKRLMEAAKEVEYIPWTQQDILR